jgi:hypothetical protein
MNAITLAAAQVTGNDILLFVGVIVIMATIQILIWMRHI